MTTEKDDQISSLEELLAVSEQLGVMMKRALRTVLLEHGADAEIFVDISDLEIPGAPETARFFIGPDDELEVE